MVSTATGARERVVWVTATGGTVDHAVTPEDLSAGIGQAGNGFMAVCGRRFWAAPLVAEPGPTCFRCVRFLRARASMRSAEERLRVPRYRRDSPVGRWLSALLSRSAKAGTASSRHARGASPVEATGRASTNGHTRGGGLG